MLLYSEHQISLVLLSVRQVYNQTILARHLVWELLQQLVEQAFEERTTAKQVDLFSTV